MAMALGGYSNVIMIVIVTIFFPCIAMGTEYVVGDHHGWATGFDYNIWAADKVFKVGDSLAFQNCTVPSNHSDALRSGNDVIVLASPGQKWYLCGVGEHCTTGQKLAITVVASTISSSPSPVQHTKKLFGGFHF
ncbi:Blue copper protein [Arachis hypogaea]|nr:Blue copper protein [Arachis hypogaea]